MNMTMEHAIILSWRMNRQIFVMLGTDGKFHLRLAYHASMGTPYCYVVLDEIFMRNF